MSRPLISVVLIAVAIVFFAIGRYSGVHQPPVGPKVAVYASIDLTCGDKAYTVSTGSNGGHCTNDTKNAGCADGKGNGAAANCQDGCKNSDGSGSCSVKKL